MLREFHPRDVVFDEPIGQHWPAEPHANVKRIIELQRCLDLYGNTQDYWLGEVVEDWRNELAWRLKFVYEDGRGTPACSMRIP